MKRREFLKFSANLSALALLSMTGIGCSRQAKGIIALDKLPYANDKLQPYISEKTLEFHYGKHHKGYVNKINRLIAGTPYEQMSLLDIIKNTHAKPDKAAIFNNASQVFNHTFYWNSMKPKGGGMPKGKIGEQIKNIFGNYDNFAQEFTQAASSQFGSGWAWLVKDGSNLKIIQTSNAENPIAQGYVPLLTIDVWEHAYYLDYQNRRNDYIQAYLKHLVNWDFAEKNFE